MRDELEEKLYKEFPYLYRSRKWSLRKSLLAFGLEIGDGWYSLIYMLSTAIMHEVKKHDKLWRYRHIIERIKSAWNTVMWYQPDFFMRKTALGRVPRFLWYGDSGFSISQVKEKYGTLRFYMHSATDEMLNAIEIAESASSSICEQCGQSGKTRGSGWAYTACAKHAHEDDLTEEEKEELKWEKELEGEKADPDASPGD